MPDPIDRLPSAQYLILEVLAARTRLGENVWTFPARLRPVLDQLAAKGHVGWKGGVVAGTCRAWLTAAGRASVLDDGYVSPLAGRDELIAALWLYTSQHTWTQLTTEQKDLFADIVDAAGVARQVDDGEELHPVVQRWWRT